MASLDCPCCGFVLDVPPALREGARFRCAHCGMILKLNEGARAFRWASLDPYLRKHGASRGNLWGGLIGALIWLPALAIVMAARGRFEIGLLAALTVPYLVLLAILRQLRARTPALLWICYVWTALGVYLLFLRTLLTLVPEWAAALQGDLVSPGLLSTLTVLGGLWAVAGSLGALWYRSTARRLPSARGTPPAAA